MAHRGKNNKGKIPLSGLDLDDDGNLRGMQIKSKFGGSRFEAKFDSVQELLLSWMMHIEGGYDALGLS